MSLYIYINICIFTHYKSIPIITFITSQSYFFFFLVRMLKIYLSKFQLYNTALLTIATMLFKIYF